MYTDISELVMYTDISELVMYTDISELVGKTLWKIDVSRDSLRFYTTEAEEYLMYHDQDCVNMYISKIW
jgi:hypothetical protein